MSYYQKYIKYKQKYLKLLQYGGIKVEIIALTPKEQESKHILELLIKAYNLPILHNKVIIKENAQSISFPDITIKQTTDILDLCYLFIHENMHHAVKNITQDIIQDTKREFPDWQIIGKDFENFVQPPYNYDWFDNFGNHMIVIYNSMQIMKQIFPEEYEDYFNNPNNINPSPYHNFERWLLKNQDRVKKFLKKHKQIYKYKIKRKEEISFPSVEWMNLKKYLDQGKFQHTVRAYQQYNKYKIGQVYYHPFLGNIKITHGQEIQNPIKDIPWWNDMDKQFQDQILSFGKTKMQWFEYMNNETYILKNTKYLYHGSPTKLENYIDIMPSHLVNKEKVVYGTQYRWLALIFCVKFYDNNIKHGHYHYASEFKEGDDYVLEEQYPHAFDILENKSGYIYKISSKNFKHDNRLGMQGMEFISYNKEKIIEKEYIKDILEELKKYKFIKFIKFGEKYKQNQEGGTPKFEILTVGIAPFQAGEKEITQKYGITFRNMGCLSKPEYKEINNKTKERIKEFFGITLEDMFNKFYKK